MSRAVQPRVDGGIAPSARPRGVTRGVRAAPPAVTRAKSVKSTTSTGILSVDDFVRVATEAMRDVFEPSANPSGFVDLAMLDSRLLDGYDTSGTGLERKAPSSGIELRQCTAQMLVEGGHGAPWVKGAPGMKGGWLSPEWVTILNAKSEAEAVESVVAAALAATEEPAKTGVLVLAPYRPAWPSPGGRLSRLSHRETSSSHTGDDGSDAPTEPTAASVLYVDPSAHGGDITAALDAGAETLRHGSHGAEVGAVVLGNPSPATGTAAGSGAVLAVARWCQSHSDDGVHLVADETGACGVYVSKGSVSSSAVAGVAAAVAAGAAAPTSKKANKIQSGSDSGPDSEDEPAWGRAAGFMGTSLLWRKGDTRAHVVTSFGPSAGIARGKTTCLLLTRDETVRSNSGSDPFAGGLQALMGDGGTVAREAIGHHNKLLRRRRTKVRTALARLGVATGPAEGGGIPAAKADGGGFVWIDLTDFVSTFEEETRLWDSLANTHRVVLVPGQLCGAATPGFFRAAVAGTDEALEAGLQRLELGVRSANDTGCG